jgi:hypothetical protein
VGPSAGRQQLLLLTVLRFLWAPQRVLHPLLLLLLVLLAMPGHLALLLPLCVLSALPPLPVPLRHLPLEAHVVLGQQLGLAQCHQQHLQQQQQKHLRLPDESGVVLLQLQQL